VSPIPPLETSTGTRPGAARAGGSSFPGPHDDRVGESLLTADEVANLLGVPTSWVYEQSRAGRIPTVTLGRYRRYRRAAIEAWVEHLEAPARGARTYAGSVR